MTNWHVMGENSNGLKRRKNKQGHEQTQVSPIALLPAVVPCTSVHPATHGGCSAEAQVGADVFSRIFSWL